MAAITNPVAKTKTALRRTESAPREPTKDVIAPRPYALMSHISGVMTVEEMMGLVNAKE